MSTCNPFNVNKDSDSLVFRTWVIKQSPNGCFNFLYVFDILCVYQNKILYLNNILRTVGQYI